MNTAKARRSRLDTAFSERSRVGCMLRVKTPAPRTATVSSRVPAPERPAFALCYAALVPGTVFGASTTFASATDLPLGGCTIERDAL